MIIRVRAKAALPVVIRTSYITLGAFLKLSGAAGTGGQARHMIDQGTVWVDGALCTARGRKLRPGMRVRADGQTFLVEGMDHGN